MLLDPIERLAAHLIALGEWSTDRQRELDEEARRTVRAAAKEAEGYGTLLDGRPLQGASRLPPESTLGLGARVKLKLTVEPFQP